MGNTKRTDNARRNFLKWLWVIIGGAAFFEIILVILSFFRPAEKELQEKAKRTVIRAGHADTFELGSVTAFTTGRFYLYRHEDGGFLALSGKCTHLGCALPWDKEKKKFICPCHASQFDINGNVLSSPAPKALDLFKITMVNKEIQVDVSNRIKRNRFNKTQLVYPETVGGIVKSGANQ